MDIAGAISDAIANLLRPAVKVLLEGMFGIINDSVGYAGKELSKDPETWNSGMFSLLRNVSINAVVPIAKHNIKLNTNAFKLFTFFISFQINIV